MKTTLMPLQPLPVSQASVSILAYTMVAKKFLDCLPLYRQEKIWACIAGSAPLKTGPLVVEAGRNAPKSKKQGSSEEWVATKAIGFYKRLYQLEEQIRHLLSRQRHEKRQREALPIWDTFMEWSKKVQILGVRHANTRRALNYLIKHEAGLRRIT